MKFPAIAAVLFCCWGTSVPAQSPAVKDTGFSDSSATEELIRKAQAFYEAYDYANSIKALEDALNFCPGNARLHLEAALKYQAAGDYTEARTEMIAAYQAYPKLGLVFYLSGHARLQVRDFYGAITDMSLAIYIEPRETIAYVPRGTARYELGDFQGAISDYTVHIESRQRYNPGMMAMAYYYRGRAYFELIEGIAAMADLTSALKLDPRNTSAYYLRSLQHKRNGNLAAAISDCNAALAIKPGIPYLIITRMWLFHELKDFGAAERDANLLTEGSSSGLSVSWFNRGTLADAEGRIEPAISDYQKAISIAETKSDREAWIYANFWLDLLNRRMRRTNTAGYLKDVFDWPDDWPKRIGIYLAGHTSAESLERDARNAEDVFVKNRQICEAYYYIGMINLIKGTHQVAEDYFKRAVETQQVRLVEFNLARAQLQQLKR